MCGGLTLRAAEKVTTLTTLRWEGEMRGWPSRKAVALQWLGGRAAICRRHPEHFCQLLGPTMLDERMLASPTWRVCLVAYESDSGGGFLEVDMIGGTNCGKADGPDGGALQLAEESRDSPLAWLGAT